MSKKQNFEVEIDGVKTKFSVLVPSHKVEQKANLVYNKAFADAVAAGSLVRGKIESVIKDQNLWDETKKNRYQELTKALLEGEKKLSKGGMKMSEAKALGIQMRRDRAEFQMLRSAYNELDRVTAEASAEQARFNYMVSACTVYSDVEKYYFKDVEDYLSRDEDPVVLPAAQAMGKIIYNLEDNFEATLPENKFLLKYGFAREGDLHLVNKNGQAVDTQGRLVDDKGRLINDKGELVDSEGNLLTDKGDYKVDFVEFEDDLAEVK